MLIYLNAVPHKLSQLCSRETINGKCSKLAFPMTQFCRYKEYFFHEGIFSHATPTIVWDVFQPMENMGSLRSYSPSRGDLSSELSLGSEGIVFLCLLSVISF